ncbi:MAG: hypothetical protein WCK37_05130 [Candidatus Falkowbacteria bacterium]
MKNIKIIIALLALSLLLSAGVVRAEDNNQAEDQISSSTRELINGKLAEIRSEIASSTKNILANGFNSLTSIAPQASKMLEALKGRILLQVENHGEAWYVSPKDGSRYYLKDGTSAYSAMRGMGLGVSNGDINKLQKGDRAMLNRLKGHIVLQVQNHGEAYYINPATLKMHYLKNGDEAYKIMRTLSLGVTNADLGKIKASTTEETSSSVALSDKAILATATVNGNSVNFSWSLQNMTSSMGFKVVKADHENPVYPGDDYHYLSDANVTSDTWSDLGAGTYYFRVCEYLGGKCGVYSQNLKVEITE